MIKKLSLSCLCFIGMINFIQSQNEVRIPNTIYLIDQNFNLPKIEPSILAQLRNLKFRNVDVNVILRNEFEINFANIGVPATTFDYESYENLELDKYFFKGYDLYQIHSSQLRDYNNRKRIEGNKAKALERSYSQFGVLKK